MPCVREKLFIFGTEAVVTVFVQKDTKDNFIYVSTIYGEREVPSVRKYLHVL